MITQAFIVCKEITFKGINIYQVGFIDNENSDNSSGLNLQYCKIRERYSSTSKFYAIGAENYNNESTKEYIFGLIEKGVESNLYTYI